MSKIDKNNKLINHGKSNNQALGESTQENDYYLELANRGNSYNNISSGSENGFVDESNNDYYLNLANYGRTPIKGPEGDSQYDEGWIPGLDPNEYRRSQQSGWDLIGNALVNTASEVVFGAGEGLGYLLDIPEWKNLMIDSEVEFSNWFSDIMKEAKKKTSDAHPIYMNASDMGFNPGSAQWWASNAPSIASAVSLAIPAMGATKAISGAMNALRIGMNVNKGVRAGVKGLTTALFSRKMENTMEAAGNLESSLKQLRAENLKLPKDQRKSDEELKLLAGNEVRKGWYKNLALLAFDIPQYLSIMKGFSAADGALKATKKQLESYGKQMISEGFEEGAQFISGKETEYSALTKAGFKPESDFGDRMLRYAADGEMWTSVVFGALGGGVFTAYGNMMTNKKIAKQKIYDQVIDPLLEKQRAAMTGSAEEFMKADDEMFVQSMVAHADNGSLKKMEKDLKELKKNENEFKDEELSEFHEKIDERLEDIKAFRKLYDKMVPGKRYKEHAGLGRLELAHTYNKRMAIRRNQKIDRGISEVRAEDEKLNVSGLLAELKHTAYKRLHSKNENEKQSLKEKEKRLREELISSEQYPDIRSDKDIKSKIQSINDPVIDRMYNIRSKNEEAIRASDQELAKLTSKEGRSELASEIKKEEDRIKKEEEETRKKFEEKVEKQEKTDQKKSIKDHVNQIAEKIKNKFSSKKAENQQKEESSIDLEGEIDTNTSQRTGKKDRKKDSNKPKERRTEDKATEDDFEDLPSDQKETLKDLDFVETNSSRPDKEAVEEKSLEDVNLDFLNEEDVSGYVKELEDYSGIRTWSGIFSDFNKAKKFAAASTGLKTDENGDVVVEQRRYYSEWRDLFVDPLAKNEDLFIQVSTGYMQGTKTEWSEDTVAYQIVDSKGRRIAYLNTPKETIDMIRDLQKNDPTNPKIGELKEYLVRFKTMRRKLFQKANQIYKKDGLPGTGNVNLYGTKAKSKLESGLVQSNKYRYLKNIFKYDDLRITVATDSQTLTGYRGKEYLYSGIGNIKRGQVYHAQRLQDGTIIPIMLRRRELTEGDGKEVHDIIKSFADRHRAGEINLKQVKYRQELETALAPFIGRARVSAGANSIRIRFVPVKGSEKSVGKHFRLNYWITDAQGNDLKDNPKITYNSIETDPDTGQETERKVKEIKGDQIRDSIGRVLSRTRMNIDMDLLQSNKPVGNHRSYKEFLFKRSVLYSSLGARKDANGNIVSNFKAMDVVLENELIDLDDSSSNYDINKARTLEKFKEELKLSDEFSMIENMADSGVEIILYDDNFRKSNDWLPKGTDYFYRPKDKKIYLHEDFLSEDLETQEEIIAHELLHAKIMYELDLMSNEEYKNSELNKDLESFWQSIPEKQKQYASQDPGMKILIDYVNTRTTQEIVTLAFTNKKFAQWLNNMKTDQASPESESFWNKLKEIIKSFIDKIIPGSKLDELSSIMDRHINKEDKIDDLDSVFGPKAKLDTDFNWEDQFGPADDRSKDPVNQPDREELDEDTSESKPPNDEFDVDKDNPFGFPGMKLPSKDELPAGVKTPKEVRIRMQAVQEMDVLYQLFIEDIQNKDPKLESKLNIPADEEWTDEEKMATLAYSLFNKYKNSNQGHDEYYDYVLNNFTDLWTEFRFHLQREYSIKVDRGESLEEGDEELTKSWDDQGTFKSYSKDSAPNKIKKMIKTTLDLVFDENGNPVKRKSELSGNSTFLNFDLIYPYIHRMMAGMNSGAEMISKLDNMAKVLPSIGKIKEKLEADPELKSAWIAHFRNQSPDMLRISIDSFIDKNNPKLNVKTMLSNRNDYRLVQEEAWKNRLNSLFPVDERGKVDYRGFDQEVLPLKKQINRMISLDEELNPDEFIPVFAGYISKFGITLDSPSGNLIEKAIRSEYDQVRNSGMNSDQFLRELHKRFKFIEEDLKKRGNVNENSGDLRILAEVLGDFIFDKVENSAFNVSGNQFFPVSLPNYISDLVQLVQNDDEMSRSLIKDKIREIASQPHMKYSNWLNMFMDYKDNSWDLDSLDYDLLRYTIDYQLMDGIKIQRGEGREYGKMTSNDWDLATAISFLDGAMDRKGEMVSIPMPIPADGTTMYMIKTRNVRSKSKHKRSLKNSVHNIYKQELERMKQARDLMFEVEQDENGNDIIVKDQNGNPVIKQDLDLDQLIVNYHYKLGPNGEKIFFEKGKVTGNVFKFMNMVSGHADIDFNKLDVFDEHGIVKHLIEKTATDAAFDLIEKFQERIIQDHHKVLDKYKVNLDDLVKRNYSNLSENLEKNADARWRAFVKDFALNTLIHNVEFQNFFNGSMNFAKNLVDSNKRSKQTASPGMRLNDQVVRKSFRVGFIADIIKPSDQLGNLIEIIGEGIKSENSRYKNLSYDKKKLLQKKPKNLNALEQKIERIISGYKKVNVTDGQGYITIDRYREILNGTGRMNPEIDRLLKLAKQGVKLDYEQIRVVMQPVKGFHYGFQYNENLNLMSPRQLKYSSMILFPQLTKNTQLDKIRQHMENKKIDEIIYESGSKVGTTGVARVHDDNNNISDKFLKTVPVKDYRNSDYMIQQEIPDHAENNRNLFATQIAKQILANLKGEYQIGEKKYKANELIDHYFEVYSQNIVDSFKDLANEIGISYDPEGDVNIENLDLFIEKLKREAINRGMMSDMIRSVEEKDGDIRIPLFFSAQTERWESVIVSLFKNQVTKQKMPGASLVQFSSMFTKLDTDQSYDDFSGINLLDSKKQDGKLNFISDGNTITAEVYIRPTDSRFYKDGELIDINNVDPEVLEMIAYRVPTHGKHSVVKLKVVGFLPRESGSSIIVPEEITTMQDSDFDIDKLFIISKNFKRASDQELIDYLNKQGYNFKNNYETRELLEWIEFTEIDSGDLTGMNYDLKEHIENYILQSSKRDRFSLVKYDSDKSPAQNTRAARENRLADIILTIMSSPQHQKEVATPSDFDDLINIKNHINELRGISDDQIPAATFIGQREFRKRNMEAVALKGAAANFDSFTSVAQVARMSLAEPIDIFKFSLEEFSLEELISRYGEENVDVLEGDQVSEQKKSTAKSNTPEFDALPEKTEKNFTYAGIGSRETPNEIIKEMSRVATKLESLGYTLRSGGAQGADQAFESGASNKEIFYANDATDQTMKIAREIHPKPEALKEYPLKLMARNTNQVFGKNLDSPVDFVLAYTPDGVTHHSQRTIKTGGTGQAIEMASRKGIPVINMADPNWEQQLEQAMNQSYNKKTDDQESSSSKSSPPVVDKSWSWSDLKNKPVYSEEGVNTMRTRNKTSAHAHFGNPFTYSASGVKGLITAPSIEQAVKAYIDWLDGVQYASFLDEHGEALDLQAVNPDQRLWILEQIESGKLDGKKLLYMNKAGGSYDSHADALARYVAQKRKLVKPAQKSEGKHANVRFSMIGNSNSGDFLNINGDLLTEHQSQSVPAAMDSVKDPAFSQINVNTFTFNSFQTLLSIGLDVRHAATFMAQPILAKYSELYFENQGIIEQSEDKSYYELHTKLSDLLKNQLKLSQREIDQLSGDRLIKPYSVQELEDLIKDYSNFSNLSRERKIEVLIAQNDILSKFEDLRKISKKVNATLMSVKFDTPTSSTSVFNNIMEQQGIMNQSNSPAVLINNLPVGLALFPKESVMLEGLTLEKIQDQIDKIQEKLTKISDQEEIAKNLNRISSLELKRSALEGKIKSAYPVLEQYYNYSNRAAGKMLEKLMIHASEGYKKIYNQLSTFDSKERDFKQIYQSYTRHIMSDHRMFSRELSGKVLGIEKEFNNKKLSELSIDEFKSLSAAEKLVVLQQEEIIPKEEYHILNALKVDPKEEGDFKNIYIQRPSKTKYFDESIMASLDNMYFSDNEILKSTAEDLIRYSYYTSGFSFRSGSFGSYISSYVLEDIGLDKFLKEMHRRSLDGEVDAKFKDIFLRNNWFNEKHVPRARRSYYRTKEGKYKLKKSSQSWNPINEQGDLVFDLGKEGSEYDNCYNKEFITWQDKDKNVWLYQMIHEETEDATSQGFHLYRRTYKLGSGNFFEIPSGEYSMLGKNNPSGKPVANNIKEDGSTPDQGEVLGFPKDENDYNEQDPLEQEYELSQQSELMQDPTTPANLKQEEFNVEEFGDHKWRESGIDPDAVHLGNLFIKAITRLTKELYRYHDRKDTKYVKNMQDIKEKLEKRKDAYALLQLQAHIRTEFKMFKDRLAKIKKEKAIADAKGEEYRYDVKFLQESLLILNAYKEFSKFDPDSLSDSEKQDNEESIMKAKKEMERLKKIDPVKYKKEIENYQVGINRMTAKNIDRGIVIARLKKIQKTVSDAHSEMDKSIEKLSKDHFRQELIKYSANPDLKGTIAYGLRDKSKSEQNKIIQDLFNAHKDITEGQYIMDYIGDSHNPFIALLIKKYDEKMTIASQNAYRIKTEFQQKTREFKKNNGPDMSWIYQKVDDQKGNMVYTGKWITRADAEKLGKDHVAYYDYLMDRLKKLTIRLQDDNSIKNLNQIPAIYQDQRSVAEAFKAEIGWYDKNRDSVVDAAGNEMFMLRPDYVKNVSEKDAVNLSYDLEQTMNIFIDEMSNYSMKIGLESEILLAREIFARQRVLGRSKNGKTMLDTLYTKVSGVEQHRTIEAAESRTVQQLDDWMRIVFYDAGYPEQDSAINKTARVLMNYISIKGLGFNWSSGINNKVFGEIQQMMEASAGVFYDRKSYKFGWGKIHSKIGKIYGEIQNNKQSLNFEDKDAALIHYFDVSQDQDERVKSGNKMIGDKLHRWKMFTNAAYFMQHIGEFTMQNSVLLARLKFEGLYDKISLKDGKLDFGDMSKEDVAKFRNKTVAVLEQIHGRYSKEHGSAAQKHLIARLAFQFKKWVPEMYSKRFGYRSGFLGIGSEAFFNERREVKEEGMYVTTVRLIGNIFKDYKNLLTNYKVHYNELSAMEQANVRRTMQELLFLGISVTVSQLLKHVAKGMDDEPPLPLQIALYQSDRLWTELSTFLPWGLMGEGQKLRKNPMAIFGLYDNIIKFSWNTLMYPINYFEIFGAEEDNNFYEGGSYSGRSKVMHNFINLVPLGNQVYRMYNLDDNMRYYRLY